MKKNRWATLCELVKWSLPSYVFLLFSLMSIGTAHGMGSNHFPIQIPNLFGTPTPTNILSPTATSTPTPMPTSILTLTSTLISTPVPTVTQILTATGTPQLQLTPSGTMLPVQTLATETPALATPTSAPASPNSTVTSKSMAMKATYTNQQLLNVEEGDKVLNTFILPLSIGAPLLLAGGWMFWLIRIKQVNQYKPARLGIFDKIQPALWVRGHELGSDFNALHYATGISGTWPIPVMPQVPDMPTSTSPSSLTLTQSAHTSSRLSSLPTSFQQSGPTLSSNQPVRSGQDQTSFPLAMDSLNLPVQPIEARESNKYEPVFSSAIAPPTVSLDTPISYKLSLSHARPVASQLTPPPSTKDVPLLGEAMRQAQMGLFVVLGRE